MNKPLVSVIVPNYNHQKYLRERLESVYNQTYENFEVILLDDKSTDDSIIELEHFANHPKTAHFVINKVNCGSTFKQWKKGVSLAKGKYIWFAESDDSAKEDFLEKTVSVFENNEVGLVYCNSLIMDDNSKITGDFASLRNKYYNTTRWSKDYIANGTEEIEKYLSVSMTINNMNAALFSKKIITPLLDKIEQYRNCGDKFLCGLVLSKHDLAYISEGLSFYRDHSNNTTKQNASNGILFYEEIEFGSLVLSLFKGGKRKRLLKRISSIILYRYQDFIFNSELNWQKIYANSKSLFFCFSAYYLKHKSKESLKVLGRKFNG